MKTNTTHISNFGGSLYLETSTDGYAVYHESPRYAAASDSQLESWTDSRFEAVRNAARCEQFNRARDEWLGN